MINLNLAKLRKEFRSKKPDFLRTDSNKKIFKNKWRKPRGINNKMRFNKKGHGKQPRIGYSAPHKIKNLNIYGLKDILVFNVNNLDNINKETDSALISKSVGLKKKIEIAKKAKDLNIYISNLKNIDEFLRKAEESLAKRKQTKLKTSEEKKVSKEESLKKVEKKEEAKEKTSEEMKKGEEKVERELLKKEQVGKIAKESKTKKSDKFKQTPMQRSIPTE